MKARAWVFALLPATVFVWLATHLGEGSTLQAWDEHLSRTVGAGTPPALRSVFAALTHLGDPPLLWGLGLVVGAGLLLSRPRGLALLWACALLGNGLLNRALKEFFVRARPLIDGLPGPAHGYSFPSGHSSASMVAYGMLVFLAWRLLARPWRWPVTVAGAAIVLAVACSRVVLQVHYPSDVVAGLCSGSAWLLLCIGLSTPIGGLVSKGPADPPTRLP